MNALADIVREEIHRRGAISFARFMELALYHPAHGYYERLPQIGKRGDFFTSPSVGPVFGDLLGFHFASLLAETGPVQIVEAGAHEGQLARDILSYLCHFRPDLYHRTEYWIIEPSPVRTNGQRTTLKQFLPKVRWLPDWIAAPRLVNGIIFSNELLDAFPVHRLGWEAADRRWFEWGVTYANGQFSWSRLPDEQALGFDPDESSRLACEHLQIAPELAAVLPDQFTTEVSPAAVRWWIQAVDSLQQGHLLTIDYGLEAEQFLDPARSQGTLRGFIRHQYARDPLADPGEQDLTAHINFTALRNAGRDRGLTNPESLSRQAGFLTSIFERTLNRPEQFPSWTPERLRQFQTLTSPEQLGRAFSVLIQSR